MLIVTRSRAHFSLVVHTVRRPSPQRYDGSGGMAEWFKAAVLKTVDGETRPGVRIPLPPPVSSFSEGALAHFSILSAALAALANTQGISDEEHDRATNCGDPKEEHI